MAKETGQIQNPVSIKSDKAQNADVIESTEPHIVKSINIDETHYAEIKESNELHNIKTKCDVAENIEIKSDETQNADRNNSGDTQNAKIIESDMQETILNVDEDEINPIFIDLSHEEVEAILINLKNPQQTPNWNIENSPNNANVDSSPVTANSIGDKGKDEKTLDEKSILDEKTIDKEADKGIKNPRKCILCEWKKVHLNKRKPALSSFPLDPEICRVWVKNVGMEDLALMDIETLNKTMFLCRNHFDRKYIINKSLSDKAIPTKNLLYPPLSEEVLAKYYKTTSEPKELITESHKYIDGVDHDEVSSAYDYNSEFDAELENTEEEEPGVEQVEDNFETDSNAATLDEIDALFLSYAAAFKEMSKKMQTLLKVDIAKLFARYEIKDMLHGRSEKRDEVEQNVKTSRAAPQHKLHQKKRAPVVPSVRDEVEQHVKKPPKAPHHELHQKPVTVDPSVDARSIESSFTLKCSNSACKTRPPCSLPPLDNMEGSSDTKETPVPSSHTSSTMQTPCPLIQNSNPIVNTPAPSVEPHSVPPFDDMKICFDLEQPQASPSVCSSSITQPPLIQNPISIVNVPLVSSAGPNSLLLSNNMKICSYSLEHQAPPSVNTNIIIQSSIPLNNPVYIANTPLVHFVDAHSHPSNNTTISNSQLLNAPLVSKIAQPSLPPVPSVDTYTSPSEFNLTMPSNSAERTLPPSVSFIKEPLFPILNNPIALTPKIETSKDTKISKEPRSQPSKCISSIKKPQCPSLKNPISIAKKSLIYPVGIPHAAPKVNVKSSNPEQPTDPLPSVSSITEPSCPLVKNFINLSKKPLVPSVTYQSSQTSRAVKICSKSKELRGQSSVSSIKNPLRSINITPLVVPSSEDHSNSTLEGNVTISKELEAPSSDSSLKETSSSLLQTAMPSTKRPLVPSLQDDWSPPSKVPKITSNPAELKTPPSDPKLMGNCEGCVVLKNPIPIAKVLFRPVVKISGGNILQRDLKTCSPSERHTVSNPELKEKNKSVLPVDSPTTGILKEKQACSPVNELLLSVDSPDNLSSMVASPGAGLGEQAIISLDNGTFLEGFIADASDVMTEIEISQDGVS